MTSRPGTAIQEELMARRSLVACFAAMLIAAATTALAADGGKATGTLTINGKTIKLAHAYAHLAADPADEDNSVVVVTLTEEPLSADAIGKDGGLTKLDHKLNALVVRIDADKEVIEGEIHGVDIQRTGGSFTAAEQQVFEPTVFSVRRVAGKLYMRNAGRSFGTTYKYSATFDVAVAPAEPPHRPLLPGEAEARNGLSERSERTSR